MKKIIYFTTIAVATLMMWSCQDFLDIRPEATMPSQGMDYSKSENIFMPVSAAYASMRGCFGLPYIGLAEIVSDDADKGSSPSDSPESQAIDNFTFTPTNSSINTYWTSFYNVVSAANNAIEQMPLFEAEMNTDANILLTKQCAAEAKTIRAYAYFMLVRAFGSVPIIDRTMTAEELASVSQSTVGQVYAFIKKDLTDAIALLPESYASSWSGRLTKYSALALKAKVHLYQKEWDDAADCCDQVIASKRFGLLDDFRQVFSMDGENSRESLFEIQSSSLGQSSGEAPYCEYAYIQGPRNNQPQNMQGWGFNVPSQKLVTFLTNRGDTERMSATLLYRGTLTPEGDSIKMVCSNPIYNGKVYTPSTYNTWSYNGYGFDHNIRILRYAEVLLMFAEAKAQGATKGTESGYSAQSALDQVRLRVHLPSVAATLDNIYDERRAELAMEGNRFYDVVRTGRASTLLSGEGFKANKNEVFPIPSAQCQLNTNLIHTPGYTY